MKIVYLGNFCPHTDTEKFIANALERAGHEVWRVAESPGCATALSEVLKNAQPDLFLFAKGRLNGRQCEFSARETVDFVMRHRQYFNRSACWMFDLLAYEYSPPMYGWAAAISTTVDFFFSTDGYTSFPRTRNITLRQGVPDDVREGVFDARYECDVLFLGGVYDERKEWFQKLRSHFGDRLRRIDGVRGPALADVMASAKVVIGPAYPFFPSYWSNRLYVVTGYGGCLACPEVPGMRSEEGWTDGVHFKRIPMDTPGAIMHIEWLLEDQEGRDAIRRDGQAFALANFTYDHRIRKFLEVVKAEPAPIGLAGKW